MRDYTTNEAAEFLKVTRHAVTFAIYRGSLVAWKRAGRYFIDEDELTRWDRVRKLRKGGRPPSKVSA